MQQRWSAGHSGSRGENGGPGVGERGCGDGGVCQEEEGQEDTLVWGVSKWEDRSLGASSLPHNSLPDSFQNLPANTIFPNLCLPTPNLIASYLMFPKIHSSPNLVFPKPHTEFKTP